MAGLDHANPDSASQEVANPRSTRLGLVLFAFYALLYSAFVLLNAFAPAVMEYTIGGINVAVLYGLGLIAAAFILAVFYDWLCRMHARATSPNDEAGQ